MTAHHSVLIFEVLETASLPEMDDDWEPGEDAHELVKELYDIWDNLSQRSMLEPGTMHSRYAKRHSTFSVMASST